MLYSQASVNVIIIYIWLAYTFRVYIYNGEFGKNLIWNTWHIVHYQYFNLIRILYQSVELFRSQL